MLCVPIKGKTLENVASDIANACEFADLIELRFDLLTDFNVHSHTDIQKLKKIFKRFSVDFIFTLRSASHGGAFALSSHEQQQWIAKLATLEPAYIDIEGHISTNFVRELTAKYQHLKIIISHHDVEKTPVNLDEIFANMSNTPAWGYKIATFAQSPLDAMRLLIWAKEKTKATATPINIIPIPMGEHGSFARIIAPILGFKISYAPIQKRSETAPGQIDVDTLLSTYRYRSLNAKTAVYGLLGHPVSKSISEETHNAFFEAVDVNAIYVKIDLEPYQINAFLQLAKQLPFKGFSITMPLKGVALDALDAISSEALAIGAANTATLRDGCWFGDNTDGYGALNALESIESIEGKTVVIIGAGGAAKAIAFEASTRKAVITILNRNKKTAETLAKQISATAGDLTAMETYARSGYDVLINATPLSMPISSNHILPFRTIMDINTKPKDSQLLMCALENNCSIVYGYQMFLEQALGQFKLWLTDRLGAACPVDFGKEKAQSREFFKTEIDRAGRAEYNFSLNQHRLIFQAIVDKAMDQ